MNLALPAIIFFLFILPGLVFCLALYGDSKEEASWKYIPLSKKSAINLAASTIIHLITITIASLCLSHQINISNLVIILVGKQSNNFSDVIHTINNTTVIEAVIYQFLACLLAGLLGLCLKKLIKKHELDRKFPILGIDSEWYRLLKGYDWSDNKPDGVYITAIVEMGGEAYLYSGVMENFYLNSDGSMNRILISMASRRHITNDKSKSESHPNDKSESESHPNDRFYPIDGDCLVLKYSSIKNLNIQFFSIT